MIRTNNFSKMNPYQAILFTLAFIYAVGDLNNFIKGFSSQDDGVVSQYSTVGLPGAEGFIKVLRLGGKKKAGGAEHTKNKRPSTKGKHQRGQARRDRDQNRAGGKRQKGGKDGSRSRGGGRSRGRGRGRGRGRSGGRSSGRSGGRGGRGGGGRGGGGGGGGGGGNSKKKKELEKKSA